MVGGGCIVRSVRQKVRGNIDPAPSRVAYRIMRLLLIPRLRLIFTLGFITEIIADNQKTKFRKDPINKDKFITSGIWKYSRHPNYLGEITLWLGISVISFSSLQGLELLTLISPIFTYILLVYISGVRILEYNGNKKWGHLENICKYW